MRKLFASILCLLAVQTVRIPFLSDLSSESVLILGRIARARIDGAKIAP